MKEEPTEQAPPDAVARSWLYAFEQCARQRAYDAAQKLLHKHCIYFGLMFDDPMNDWAEMWNEQLAFSFDLSRTKFVIEHNLSLISAVWVAQGLIHRSPAKVGRASIALMRFTGDKILAVHFHISRWHEGNT